MKKILLSLIAAVTISGNLIAMNYDQDDHTGELELNLHEKPSNISTYDWSKEKAANLVNKKRLKLISLLKNKNNNNETINDWNKLKENLSNHLKSEILNASTQLMDNFKNEYLPVWLEKEILNVISTQGVINALDINNKYINKNKSIIVKRKNNDDICFLVTNSSFKIDSPLFTDNRNIYFCLSILYDNKITKYCKGLIGHEIAHIICQHTLESRLFLNFYEHITKEMNISINENDFKNTFAEFKRAQEIEADIVGTFNDKSMIEDMINFLGYVMQHYKTNVFIGLSDDHPSDYLRSNYFNHIYDSIHKEKSTKQQPTILQKPKIPANKPKVIINSKPAPVKKETIVVKPLRPTTRPQMPVNKPVKPAPVKPQPIVDKKPALVNKPVIVTKPAPVNTKVNKVSEIAKKFDKFFLEQNKNNNLQKK